MRPLPPPDTLAPVFEKDRAAMREKLLADARRHAPPGFDVETFWEHLMEHLEAPVAKRLLVFHDLTEGAIGPRRLLEMQQEVEEQRSWWNEQLGSDLADFLRRTIARRAADPLDLTEVLALRAGDPDEDAALLLYAFLREAGGPTPEAGERRLREAVALQPSLASLWVVLSKGLSMLAMEETSPATQKRLFLDAARWLDEALRREPEHPEALFAHGKVLAELAVLSAGDERMTLTYRARERFIAAAQFPATAADGFGGAGTISWTLAGEATDEAEKREHLEEALQVLRRALALGVRKPDGNFPLAHVALDLGWMSDAAETREALFAESCRHFEASSRAETLEAPALACWGSAVVGLAIFRQGEDRRRLAKQAAELFQRSAARGDDPAATHDKAVWAWLKLAGESTGGERREAARRGAEAARRLNQVKPGEGDYNLACALSILGEHAEAAGRLIAALKHEPRLTSLALADPDLESLWEARPQLRKRVEALQVPGDSHEPQEVPGD